MKYQRGFIDWALLHIAEKTRWFIRYPATIFVLFAAWSLLQLHLIFIPLLLLACACVLTKEISPSILLMTAALWLWPNGFFDTPFAYMTIGIICHFIFSVILFISSPIIGLVIYSKLQYKRYVDEISKNPI